MRRDPYDKITENKRQVDPPAEDKEIRQPDRPKRDSIRWV